MKAFTASLAFVMLCVVVLEPTMIASTSSEQLRLVLAAATDTCKDEHGDHPCSPQ
ncbi:hypothetical protein PN499_16740 [Kamptonema animale CS-326]|jgi:hypothetical protein|uniref:hypothetical protein n=1 Tax=Kamptonema animale TaxID=92934 RepID=UPI00232C8505|nr:hypothetical protein [Kamptonema animale]MDB9512838.1 hypothetical protein [Kamptonema animale CS-326]